MTTKNIQDVVADLEWLASPAAETLTDGTRITEFCKAVHKLDLTQLVKEVEAGERKRIYDSFADCPSFDDALNEREALTPPTSDVIEK